jgi:hypothetical protein
MNRNMGFCILLTILILSYGCSFMQEIQNPKGTPTSEIDQLGDRLEITFLRGPEIHTLQNVSLVITNLSEYCIVFPFDFGIELWVDVNDVWEEIDNMVQYIPEEDIYLEPVGESFSTMGVSIRPDLSDFPLLEKTDFKAILSGHLCDDISVIVEKEILFTVSP